ncbi:MAG TPA: hypothetical protein VNK04_17165 [Gemmataceae bacterium]|nr:hypothetical protein [Gemmataceae bacterium]
MRFWFREVSGWLLVALGLLLFYVCYLMLLTHDVTEAWPVAFIGIIVFRGGIHLLKVAVAARLCTQVHEGRAAGRVPTTDGAPPRLQAAPRRP